MDRMSRGAGHAIRAIHRSRGRGQAVLELTLLVPFLVTLFFGTLDMARAIRTQAAIMHAAHVGLAYAQGVTDASTNTQITAHDIITKTVQASQGLVTPGEVQVLGTLDHVQPITISVTVPFTTITPFTHIKSLTGSAYGETLP